MVGRGVRIPVTRSFFLQIFPSRFFHSGLPHFNLFVDNVSNCLSLSHSCSFFFFRAPLLPLFHTLTHRRCGTTSCSPSSCRSRRSRRARPRRSRPPRSTPPSSRPTFARSSPSGTGAVAILSRRKKNSKINIIAPFITADKKSLSGRRSKNQQYVYRFRKYVEHTDSLSPISYSPLHSHPAHR